MFFQVFFFLQYILQQTYLWKHEITLIYFCFSQTLFFYIYLCILCALCGDVDTLYMIKWSVKQIYALCIRYDNEAMKACVNCLHFYLKKKSVTSCLTTYVDVIKAKITVTITNVSSDYSNWSAGEMLLFFHSCHPPLEVVLW